MSTPRKIVIIAMSLALAFVILVVTILIINSYRSNKQKSQDEYINSYLKEVGNQKLDNVDSFYYELLKDNYFAIFNKEADRKEREKIYYYSMHQDEAILEICKQPPNLYGIVLLYDIDRKKGLLECETYDKIYFDSEYLDGYDFRRVIIEIGDRKEIYLIRITPDIYVRRVSAIKIKEIDKYGNVIDTIAKKIFDEKNTRYNFNDLCLDGEKVDVEGWYGRYYGDDVAVSKHFREKYPNFLDLFIHYSPIEYNRITLIDLDIENQKATFEVDSVLECKKRTYEIEYKLDNNKYLEDINIKMFNETLLNVDSESVDRMAQTFYINSSWNNIKLSSGFKNKYRETKGVFPDITQLDYNFSFRRDKGMYDALSFKVNNEKYQIRKFKINNRWIYYLWFYIVDKNNCLDDVIYEKLPYNGSMTLEEVKDAYIRDYVEKK